MKTLNLSAGAVIIRRRKDKCEFLLLRCFSYWDFPKGRVEINEDIEDAARREVFEETNLKKLQATWGNDFFETLPYGKYKVARYYLFEVGEVDRVKLLPNPLTGITEHHEFLWLPFEAVLEKLVPRVQSVLRWANTKVTFN